MIGVKDIFMSREKNRIVYEFIFENEEMAKLAKQAIKANIHTIIPQGFDKLIKEIEIEQTGNKIIQTFVMKNEKVAECLFYLIKEVQSEVSE